ncbi:EpsG family protein [Vibrio cyclitrophicus]|uniref:EpsG family protein n=1 Tax=Vibrio cyclitrophicus TaxID=47951 RepID=UPI000CC9C942|nr:hypothetical protein BCU19_20975 [Vibrio cyclitrophicus]
MVTSYKYQQNNITLIIFSINIILLAFSPYLSLGLLFVSLILAEGLYGKKSYLYFLPFIVILLAYLASSRGIFETPKDDLSDYYKNFIALNDGNLLAIFEWGQGIEIGLPVVSAVISLVAPDAPPRLFLFCHLVVIFSLFFLFLHKVFLTKSSSPAIYILVVCLFLGFTGIANLLRQSYASIFLLAAFWYVGRKKYCLLIVATLFHFSSPLIYFLLRWLIQANKKKLIITLISSILFYSVIWKLILPILEQYSFLKLTAYLIKDGEDLDVSIIIRAYKEIFLLCIFGVVYNLLGYWKSLSSVYSSILFLMLVFFLELMLPGISLRITHAVISFCIGPIVFYILCSRKEFSMFSVAVLIPLLFVLKIMSFTNNPNDMALFNDQVIAYSEPFGYIEFLYEDINNDKRNWKIMKYQ